MSELGVILQDGVGQPPGLTVPAQDALVQVVQGLENEVLQRLYAPGTPARQDRGAFMTKCGSVRSTANGRREFTAYATEHCAWIHLGALE
jgi:hypothetical protein